MINGIPSRPLPGGVALHESSAMEVRFLLATKIEKQPATRTIWFTAKIF
jgi:hypothetical protein